MNACSNEKPSTSTETDPLELGESEFDLLVKKSWHVDKTMFIKAIFEVTSRVLISAPRRFCKSTNMNMLKKFLEIEVNERGFSIQDQTDENGDQLQPRNRILFENMNIFKNEQAFFKQHFGTYPVIYADFKRVCGNNYGEYLAEFGEVLNEAFVAHPYLLNSDELDEGEKGKFRTYYDVESCQHLSAVEMKSGLQYLSKCLSKHFDKKVYVLIDEFDAPVSTAMYNEELSERDVRKIINFIRPLISNLVKGNVNVGWVLLNACHHVGDVLFPDGNNIIHYPFLSKEFCKYYGFTAAEVKQLLKKCPEDKINAVQNWYNGYRATDKSGGMVEIYSNYSVLKYLGSERICSYWAANTLKRYVRILQNNKMQSKITELMNNENVIIHFLRKLDIQDVMNLRMMICENPKDIADDHVDLFIQHLYENGYLNVLQENRQELTLNVPNNEIRDEFCRSVFTAKMFIEFYNFQPEAIDAFKAAMTCLLENKSENEVFVDLANSIRNLYQSTSLLPVNEFEFHACLFCFIKSAFSKTCTILGEAFAVPQESRQCDIGVINQDKSTGIVLELTLNYKDSVHALNQIINREYFKILLKEIEHKFFVGIHMSREKRVSVSYSLVHNFELRYSQTVSSA